MTRGVLLFDVIWPPLALVGSVLGPTNVGWLKALNASQENWST